MSAAKAIELAEDLQAFAEERVRAGQYASVADVVRHAMEAQKLALLRGALDVGAAQLDAGDYIEGTADEIASGIREGRSFDDMKR